MVTYGGLCSGKENEKSPKEDIRCCELSRMRLIRVVSVFLGLK